MTSLRDPDQPDPLGYHVIPGTLLLDLLRRAHSGEDPDLLLAEAYANADHEGDSDE